MFDNALSSPGPSSPLPFLPSIHPQFRYFSLFLNWYANLFKNVEIFPQTTRARVWRTGHWCSVGLGVGVGFAGGGKAGDWVVLGLCLWMRGVKARGVSLVGIFAMSSCPSNSSMNIKTMLISTAAGRWSREGCVWGGAAGLKKIMFC